MEFIKHKKFLDDDNYVHCSICGNYRNMKAFSHRKSKVHQQKLSFKLRKIAFHLSLKKKMPVVIHDEHWPGRDTKRFCHFCGQSYAEHYTDDEFVVENLGSLYHHADFCHAECVKAFLKRNFSNEEAEKYCIKKSDLNSFLKKLPEVKKTYLKKMDALNNMVLKQIKSSEDGRKKLVTEQLQVQSSIHQEVQNSVCDTDKKDAVDSQLIMKKLRNENKGSVKIPPWLDDVCDNSAVENRTSVPVIGPTMDTWLKHVTNLKKKNLSKNRVGTSFKQGVHGTFSCPPSYHGMWNHGQRKQLQIQSNWRNKKSSF